MATMSLKGKGDLVRRVIPGFILAFGVVVGAAAIQSPTVPSVRTEGGLVSGEPGRETSIAVYKGIPYAAAPVGPGRWSAPGPVVRWTGVRSGARFGASCIQVMVEDVMPVTREFMAFGEVSEDCLFLNVWTPATSRAEKRPVLVYLHGGGFTGGSGQVPVYDGEGLAKKGLVAVTINYRLGVLGFLAHPELTKESGHNASGNYGLMDQVAALQWIRRNIAAFGGDPARVTIAGQSAGGMSVHALIGSPLARGLFQRAIVESGGSSLGGGMTMGGRTLADAETAGVRFAESKGVHSLAELRALTWQKLIEPVPAPAGARGPGGGMRFSPIVDGYFSPLAHRDAVQQGTHNDVPVLTGVNLGELAGMTPQPPPTAEVFRAQAERRYGPMAAEFLRLYPAANDEQARNAHARSSRDSSLVSLYLWARERARTSKTPAFIYLWDHAIPGPDAERYGAFHTAEVPYVLNTLDRSPRPFVEADRQIAAMASSYWASFAAAGDPNAPGLPRWDPAGTTPVVMEIGDKTGPVPAADAERFAFFEKYLIG
jgi:para-nitrobenzyl esterase